MQKYWSRRAEAIEPYVAGEQPKEKNIVKLNTNENPYPPSPGALAALMSIDGRAMRMYPDPSCAALRAAIAALHGVGSDMVFVGNGSDDVLAVAFMAFFDDGLAFPDITYSFYPVWASLFGIRTDLLPVKEDFSIEPSDYFGKPCAVIANPNAPTSLALSRNAIADIAANISGAFVVDEAYAEFGAESAIPLIAAGHDNIVVTRTLSKSHSLAGMRVGYAIGTPHMIEAMNRIRDSYNSYPVDTVAQRVAFAAVSDRSYTEEIIAKIKASRERLTKGLAALGFSVLPSSANFVFASHPSMSGGDLKQALAERGIIVRHFNAPRISDHLRISVGTDGDVDRLIEELKKILF